MSARFVFERGESPMPAKGRKLLLRQYKFPSNFWSVGVSFDRAPDADDYAPGVEPVWQLCGFLVWICIEVAWVRRAQR